MPAGAQTWDHTLGNAANTGRLDVLTAPATTPVRTIAGLGQFASGVGPVLGASDVVYLGNFAGELRAIRPDGTQAWLRKLLREQHIVTSPVVGGDGSIYVVGTNAPRVGDHDEYDTTLYRFNDTGAMLWSKDLPGGTPASVGNGQGAGAPNIWRSGGSEMIVVPMAPPNYGGFDITLLAYSTGGVLLFRETVTRVPPGEITGCSAIFGCFHSLPIEAESCEQRLPRLPVPPMPTTAIYARSGEPVVIMADSYQNIVGYTLSPADGFREVFRRHVTNDELPMSAPVAVADGHSMTIGWVVDEKVSKEHAWFLVAGPHPSGWTDFELPKYTRRTPIVTADGRIVTLSQDGLAVIRTFPSTELFQTVSIPFAGGTARAAVSKSHMFISTCNALLTLDPASFLQVAQFDWQQGGSATPAIGPDGRLYALAGGTLFIFAGPPKPCPNCQDNRPKGNDGVVD